MRGDRDIHVYKDTKGEYFFTEDFEGRYTIGYYYSLYLGEVHNTEELQQLIGRFVLRDEDSSKLRDASQVLYGNPHMLENINNGLTSEPNKQEKKEDSDRIPVMMNFEELEAMQTVLGMLKKSNLMDTWLDKDLDLLKDTYIELKYKALDERRN